MSLLRKITEGSFLAFIIGFCLGPILRGHAGRTELIIILATAICGVTVNVARKMGEIA